MLISSSLPAPSKASDAAGGDTGNANTHNNNAATREGAGAAGGGAGGGGGWPVPTKMAERPKMKPKP